ncbi:hypothetical protein ACX6XY_19855 [Streptomyces sp. O3]
MGYFAGLAAFAVCAVGAMIAAVGTIAMALPGRPQPWPVHLLRRAAWLTAYAAVAAYSIGAATVGASELDYNNPAPACYDGFDKDTVQGLSHHRSSYLPLRFDCIRDDGTHYPSDPGYAWINLTTLLLALSSAVLLTGASHLAERERRLPGRPE